MARQKSFKEMAIDVTERVYERLCQESRDNSRQRTVDLKSVKLSFESWIEKVSELPGKELREMAPGAWIAIDGVQYLVGNLLIVKEFHKTGSAEPLLNSHDEKKTNRIPLERLWTPSLFPKLDYKETRKQQIILGDALRFYVSDAGPQHWIMHDDVEDDNWKAQKTARATKIMLRKRRKSLFAKHADCDTTDHLMKKLGAWDGDDS